MLFESIVHEVGLGFESVPSPNFTKYILPLLVQVTNNYRTQ